jgi:tetratricopeptide (TPR) repeat protein
VSPAYSVQFCDHFRTEQAFILGCGKTVLARFLAENAKTELVLSHYFRDSLGVSSVQAVSFAISLLVCLCRDEAVITNPRFEGVIDIIRSLSAVAKAERERNLEQLLDILNSIFNEVSDTTIIVDALDECRDVLDGNTKRLFDYLSSLAGRCKVRVIILSRYHTNIETSFQDAYKLTMDRTKIEPDIRHFVKARICKNPSLRMLQNHILEKVSAGCQDMFLWVRLMLDGIESVDTLDEQLEVINTFPPDLFRAFDKLFSQTGQGLTPTQVNHQFEMFLLLVASIRPLTPEEISALIAVDPATHSLDERHKFSDPYATVQNLGGPFVTITEGRAQIAHASMRDFLLQRHLTLNDSDVYLTEKCLSTLNQEKYSTWQYSAYWLRKNLISAGIAVATKIGDNDDPVPYDYAAVHWQDHLVRLSKPSDTIVKKFNLFITGSAAVAWSERLVDISGGGLTNISAQVNVLATLSNWARQLPPPIKRTLLLDEFFVTAHENLGRELAEKGGDRELDYLPAVRLGQFFNIGGKSYAQFRKAFEYEKIVVDGFTKVFGPRNPHTLRARTTLINDYFFQELIEEADRELTEVAAIQLEVWGPDHADYLNTVQLLGTAKYALTKFDEAFAMLDISGKGLLKLRGDRSRDYLMNLLWKGEVVEQQKGKLDAARELYETALTTWEAIMGKKHPFSLMLQTAVSSVYRKQRNYELAEATLLAAWGERLRLFSPNSNTTVDTGIQLAITYREKRKGKEALELLDIIKKSNVFEDDFERVGQVVHIKALVEFDQGGFDEPRLELTKVIDKTTGSSRDRNNREALWVRTTLASALRQHGDNDEALMLFSELVKPMDKSNNSRPNTPTLGDEPEPPVQLKLAEEALMLVKGADPKAANKLLEDNNLQWVRPKDFWIRQGGPIADTAVMEPVKLAPKWLRPTT